MKQKHLFTKIKKIIKIFKKLLKSKNKKEKKMKMLADNNKWKKDKE